jgi:hypothetical protein
MGDGPHSSCRCRNLAYRWGRWFLVQRLRPRRKRRGDGEIGRLRFFSRRPTITGAALPTSYDTGLASVIKECNGAFTVIQLSHGWPLVQRRFGGGPRGMVQASRGPILRRWRRARKQPVSARRVRTMICGPSASRSCRPCSGPRPACSGSRACGRPGTAGMSLFASYGLAGGGSDFA